MVPNAIIQLVYILLYFFLAPDTPKKKDLGLRVLIQLLYKLFFFFLIIGGTDL